MIRRDLLKAEIERLTQVLAKIMGLKLSGDFSPAQDLFNDSVEHYFSLPVSVLENQNNSVFVEWIENSNLPAEKLDSLSEFLYYELGVNTDRNRLIAPKLNTVYQILAKKHKIVHLVNFHRQEIIKQYL